MNLPILWQNTCLGLSDDAQVIYLRGAPRDELKAFKMACEWDDALRPVLNRIFEDFYQGKHRDAYEFIRERHYRKYFPDGRVA